MAEKRYYWLKLKENYLDNPKIKKLRKIAGGDTYTIIYLKMQLESVKTEGVLKYEGIEPTFEEELALKLDEELENVKVTLAYLISQDLIENNENDYLLPEATNNIGSENSSAERVRQFRERQPKIPHKEPKSNAIRQRQYKAKELCKQVQHIPYIEDYMNNKRYNGNYYIVLKRDKMKCSICGSIENLCVHHIDGYDEMKPENNNENKMITLCRNCHSNIHAKTLIIPKEILQSIDYFAESNESNESCNSDVTLYISNSISSSKSKYLSKHKYGEYKHILLSNEEMEKLNKDYGEEETKEAIKYLDEYIEMKGAKYKSHYLALRKWVYDAIKEKRIKKGTDFMHHEYTKEQLDNFFDNLDDIEV